MCRYFYIMIGNDGKYKYNPDLYAVKRFFIEQ